VADYFDFRGIIQGSFEELNDLQMADSNGQDGHGLKSVATKAWSIGGALPSLLMLWQLDRPYGWTRNRII
jgi:hypothetical protein